MNNEKKQAPRCPYCGAEMNLEDNEDVLFGLFADEEKMYWYQCNTPSCGIQSPANHTKAGAYRAAMTRYEEPNRVLTRKEVEDAYSKTKEPICCEIMWGGTKKITWITDAVVPYRELPRHMQYAIEDDEEEVDEVHGFYIMERQEPKWKDYGKTWRCWMRNPTAQEMRDTPWKGEAGDRHDE